MRLFRRARWPLVGVVALLLAGAAIAAYVLSRESRVSSREPVLGLVAADIDGDGRDELIALHRAGEGGRISLLEAVDLDSGAVLWQRETLPSEAAPGAEVPLLLADSERVYVTSRSGVGEASVRAVTAHAVATGVQEWTWALPADEGWNVACRLALDASLVIAFSVRETESRGRLTALDRRSGEVVWRAELGNWPGLPVRVGEQLLVPTLDGTFLLDPNTGEAADAPWVRAAWPAGERTLAVHDGADGYVVGELRMDASFTPLMGEGGAIVQLPPGADPATAVALYRDDTLLAGAAVGTDALGVKALPLGSAGRDWELDFEERFGLLVRNDPWRRVAPEAAGFFRLVEPFAPVVLNRELDPPLARAALAVVDLGQGRVAWQSRTLAQRPPGLWPSSIVQRDGRFLVALPLVEDPESMEAAWRAGALLVVEGASGHVAHAWQLVDPDSEWVFPSPQVEPLPWEWHPPLLYGSDGLRLWVLDVDAGQVIWSRPEGLALRDVTPAVEAMLGELP